MFTRINFALLTVMALLVSSAAASPPEITVGIKSRDSLRAVTLSCNNGTIAFLINWKQRVGIKGKKRRHLFYRYGRDEHVMLPVVDESGNVTGYANNSRMAKAIISTILSVSQRDAVIVGIFPAGSDPVAGKWIDAYFDFEAFSKAAKKVAVKCSWDLAADIKQPQALDTKPPTPAGYDKLSRDED